jgi:hypothetical protein
MNMRLAVIAALSAAALPMATLAQQPSSRSPLSDQEYCDKLADTYVHYIGHDENTSHLSAPQGSTDGQTAVAQCHSGKAASAIPVLERELKRNGFTLPSRG